MYTYTKGTSTTAMGNMFSRGYYVFTGWNTAANGSGTTYAPGAAITLSGNMELYAQWRYVGGSSESGSSDSNDYTLHYVTNGGKHLSSETESHGWTCLYLLGTVTPSRAGTGTSAFPTRSPVMSR